MENVTKEAVVTCEGEKSEMVIQICSFLICKFTQTRRVLGNSKKKKTETTSRMLFKTAN